MPFQQNALVIHTLQHTIRIIRPLALQHDKWDSGSVLYFEINFHLCRRFERIQGGNICPFFPPLKNKFDPIERI